VRTCVVRPEAAAKAALRKGHRSAKRDEQRAAQKEFVDSLGLGKKKKL
jgi:hypothetical protein